MDGGKTLKQLTKEQERKRDQEQRTDLYEHYGVIIPNDVSPSFVRSVLYSTTVKNLDEQTLCDVCGRPKMKYLGCITCVGRDDYKHKDYNCEECIKDREYIKSTDDVFTFDGYNRTFGDRYVEMWRCNKCGYSIEFSPMYQGIEKDMLHKMTRKTHLDIWCRPIRSKKIIIDG